jgi:PrtD family type I secretion system ABC transporter
LSQCETQRFINRNIGGSSMIKVKNGPSTEAPPILARSLSACRRSIGFVGLFSCAENVLLLAVPLYSIQIFDRVLVSRSGETLFYLSVITIAAMAVIGLLDLARSHVLASVGTWLEQRLAQEAFDRAVAASLRSRPYGTEALRDLRQVRSFVGGTSIVALFDAPWAPLFIAATFILHPLLGAIALASTVLLLVMAALNEALTRSPHKAAGEAGFRSNRKLEASSRNAEVIDALGMTDAMARCWGEENREMLRLQAQAQRRMGYVVALSKFARLSVQIVMLGAAAWLAILQEVSGGTMIASTIMLGRALGPVEKAIGTWKQVADSRAAYHRLRRHFTEPPLRPATMPAGEPLGCISIEQAGYAVPGMSQPILWNVSLALAAGESAAVIGPSGAGKSMLARLIIGTVAPTKGHIRLDGADIFGWNRDDLGRHVGYLPQDVGLLEGTVKANIARMSEADPLAVVEAAKMAEAHEMILKLPQGYDTEIGEAGAFLSGGQRQRIGLARALHGRPKLVVLDESDANLDTEGQHALVRVLATLRGAGTTVVIVSHRASLLSQVDRILMLRAGIVSQCGPRQEVLEKLRFHVMPDPLRPTGQEPSELAQGDAG